MDPYLDRANDFAAKFNTWGNYVEKLSPYSPDYKEQVLAKWEECELSQRFRRLEHEIHQIPEGL